MPSSEGPGSIVGGAPERRACAEEGALPTTFPSQHVDGYSNI